jgi:hypothetical protein
VYKVSYFHSALHRYVSSKIGKQDPNSILKFISSQYIKKNHEPDRKLIIHITTGTDTTLMAKIINDIQ